MMMDARLIVGGQRDHQRAFRAQFDVDAGRLQQLGREAPASAPGCRVRARPAPPRRARLRSRRPASRRRHGSRRCPPRRDRTPSTVAPRAASRQAMPSPITPAPMMATLGALPDSVRNLTSRGGSLRWNDPDRFVGVISAAIARHPRPYALMMGVLVRFHKCLVRFRNAAVKSAEAAAVAAAALRWRSNREQTMATTMMTAEPRNISGSRLPWAIADSRRRPARPPDRGRTKLECSEAPRRARSCDRSVTCTWMQPCSR